MQPPDSGQYHSQLPWKIVPQVYLNMCSIWLWVIPPEVQVCLWMFRCGNIALLTTNFFYVANLTILTPLSLLTWCRLSFSIVGLIVFSLPTFALKSPNRIFIWYQGKRLKIALVPHKNCLLNHHFSPYLVHAHSKQWYYTNYLSELYTTPSH
jgi:hypothetical protein